MNSLAKLQIDYNSASLDRYEIFTNHRKQVTKLLKNRHPDRCASAVLI
jgi:hypothetical protein